jgi:hypothetical protein
MWLPFSDQLIGVGRPSKGKFTGPVTFSKSETRSPDCIHQTHQRYSYLDAVLDLIGIATTQQLLSAATPNFTRPLLRHCCIAAWATAAYSTQPSAVCRAPLGSVHPRRRLPPPRPAPGSQATTGAASTIAAAQSLACLRIYLETWCSGVR